jgi:general stress protein 26
VARWKEIEDSSPEFAAKLRDRLDAHVHKTMATLRADGSPRISGTETFFADGDIWIGSMPRARKARDLQRDPRIALHSGSDDPDAWQGDAKLSGTAEELTDPEGRRALFQTRGEDPPSSESHMFRIDIDEAVFVGLNDARNLLVIELWRPGQGVERTERE